MEPLASCPSHRTGVWYPPVSGFPKYFPNVVSPARSGLTWCLAGLHRPQELLPSTSSGILSLCPLALSTCSLLRGHAFSRPALVWSGVLGTKADYMRSVQMAFSG